MDDMTFDSEGKDVLRQRLSQRRKEIGFLLKMIELSPEMVAVTLHQGFRFKLPAVMDSLLAAESEELPDWASLTDAIALAPWTKDLTDVILKEPMGEWFLTVAACLEYMYGRPTGGAASATQKDEDSDEDADAETLMTTIGRTTLTRMKTVMRKPVTRPVPTGWSSRALTVKTDQFKKIS
jgi:hypothetical protein